MEPKLAKLFCNIKCQAECNAAENIWHAIVLRDKRIARIKLWAFSTAGVISLVALVPACKALLSDLTQSGFFEYLSLGFSYDGSVFFYWKELSWSILESLPIMSIILPLTLVFIFFLSLKYAIRQTIKTLRPESRSGGIRLSLSF